MLHGALDKLRELTEKLPPFPTGSEHLMFNKYSMEKGTCLSWHVFENGTVGVDKWFISEGSVMPEHTHAVKEILVVFEGSMHLVIGEQEVILNKGDSYYVNPWQKHCSHYTEDCWFLTITIPPAEEFLHGRR